MNWISPHLEQNNAPPSEERCRPTFNPNQFIQNENFESTSGSVYIKTATLSLNGKPLNSLDLVQQTLKEAPEVIF